MDWQQKYLEQLEEDISELRQKMQELDSNVDEKLEKIITEVRFMTKSRHDDYLALNKRLDDMSQKLDRTIIWTVRFSLGTFIGVAGLVVTLIFRFF